MGHSGRMRRTLLRVLVTVVAVSVILVAADLAARRYALGRVADELQQQYSLARPPEVGVAGGSFLWQAARGRFEDLAVDVDELDAQPLALTDVRVRVPQARVPTAVLLGRPGTVDLSAGTVRAEAGYDALAAQVSTGGRDVVLTRAGEDVRAATTVRVLGLGVELAVTVHPRLAGEAVRLDPVSATVGGAGVSLERAERLLEAAGYDGWTIPLEEVPAGVELQDLSVQDDGVRVRGELRATSIRAR